MKIALHKVIGDCNSHRVEATIIALVLVMGAACVVAAFDAHAILEHEIVTSYAAANAPNIRFWFERVDAQLVHDVAARDGVSGADARRVVYTRVETGSGGLLPMRLVVMRDLAAQRVGTIHRHGGDAQTADGTVLIEQSGASLLGERVGAELRIHAPSGTKVSLPIGGFVHDPSVAPSSQERVIYAFATPATAARLGLDTTLDQLLVKGEIVGAADASQLATDLDRWLIMRGTPPLRTDVLSTVHPHAMLMQAMLRVLTVLTGIAFLCTAALATSLVAAWMKREVRVVGILKTMGARWYQVAGIYLALFVPLAVLAVGIALPLGAALGRGLVQYLAQSLNIDVVRWNVPWDMLLKEAAIALLVPLVAMAVPIVLACRRPAVESVRGSGIAMPGRVGLWMAKHLKTVHNVGVTLAIRNTWRRPWRLTTMVLALASAGGLLLTTQSNYESLMHVIDTALAEQGHDIEVVMQRPEPAQRLAEIAGSVADVERAEAWRRATVTIDADAPAKEPSLQTSRFVLTGFPENTRLFQLPVLEGRLPAQGARDEVLMTRTMQELYPQLRTGSVIRLRQNDHSTSVHVVGLVEEIGQPTLYASAPTFESIAPTGDMASTVRVKARTSLLEPVEAALEASLLDAKMAPSQLLSRTTFRASLEEHFRVVGYVIQIVALTAALVGAIFLSAATGLNVLERTREIGVLRALGATPRRILMIFMAEAQAIVWLSAVLAFALSIALTLALNDAAARTLLHVAVPLRVSTRGVGVLLVAIVVVSVAVLVPLSHLLRRPVRSALAYE